MKNKEESEQWNLSENVQINEFVMQNFYITLQHYEYELCTSRSTANSDNLHSFSFRATKSSSVSTNDNFVSATGLCIWKETTD